MKYSELLKDLLKSLKPIGKFFFISLPQTDWVKLLAVPITLSIAGGIITSYIQEENRQNTLLNDYFKAIEPLFINGRLDSQINNNPNRIFVKAKSFAILRSIDMKYKEIIIRFLTESNLINEKYNGVSLAYLNLEKINLSGLNLQEANFENTNLREASLIRANLTKSNLSKANFSKANLRGANLFRANLRESYLSTDEELREIMKESIPSQFMINEIRLDTADFSEAIFEKADLSKANLRGVKFNDARLREVILREADLSGANLSNAYLRNADLRGAKLNGANLDGAILEKAKNIPLDEVKKAINWKKATYDSKIRQQLEQESL